MFLSVVEPHRIGPIPQFGPVLRQAFLHGSSIPLIRHDQLTEISCQDYRRSPEIFCPPGKMPARRQRGRRDADELADGERLRAVILLFRIGPRGPRPRRQGLGLEPEFSSDPTRPYKNARKGRFCIGGWGEIRTPETVARLPHFECGAIDHSATHPRGGLSDLFPRRKAGERPPATPVQPQIAGPPRPILSRCACRERGGAILVYVLEDNAAKPLSRKREAGVAGSLGRDFAVPSEDTARAPFSQRPGGQQRPAGDIIAARRRLTYKGVGI
jgi:hypothetical protein